MCVCVFNTYSDNLAGISISLYKIFQLSFSEANNNTATIKYPMNNSEPPTEKKKIIT